MYRVNSSVSAIASSRETGTPECAASRPNLNVQTGATPATRTLLGVCGLGAAWGLIAACSSDRYLQAPARSSVRCLSSAFALLIEPVDLPRNSLSQRWSTALASPHSVPEPLACR